ncbi:hypothetical protein [Deinococcus radiophilus]|uniref:hypothetical protein n=1 Tax=Deinococcus radiophilus TaxID=32062 RepID=UPI00361FD1C5
MGQQLVGNSGVVRRALEYVQKLGQPERRENWPTLQLGQQPSVGVIGPRSLLAHPELGQAWLRRCRPRPASRPGPRAASVAGAGAG